ncbi:MAG TPA: hypothetical protein VIO61_16315 [Anaerolineaceae bacterium]
MKAEKINFHGWENCYRLTDGRLEMIVTTDVGPRVVYFGLVGTWNEMCEYPEMQGKTGGDEWRIYGGHRLWHAPEDPVRTYYPDNFPIQIMIEGDTATLSQPVEKTTGIEKQIAITFLPESKGVQLTHRLTNHNLWAVTLAPWALTVMATGGRVILPLPPRGSHPQDLLPANTMTFWPYTDMSDARWTWGRKYVMLRQDPQAVLPQKIGAMILDGWVGYARKGHLFVKTFRYQPGAVYPDWGCSVETFTNAEMLEVETVGPVTTLAPGKMVEHIECWSLFDGVPVPETDADIDQYVLPKVAEAARPA